MFVRSYFASIHWPSVRIVCVCVYLCFIDLYLYVQLGGVTGPASQPSVCASPMRRADDSAPTSAIDRRLSPLVTHRVTLLPLEVRRVAVACRSAPLGLLQRRTHATAAARMPNHLPVTLHLADAARLAAAGPVRPVADAAVFAHAGPLDALSMVLTSVRTSLRLRAVGRARSVGRVALRNAVEQSGLVVARHHVRMGG